MKKPILGESSDTFLLTSCQYFSTVSRVDILAFSVQKRFGQLSILSSCVYVMEDRYFLPLSRFLDCLSADCPNWTPLLSSQLMCRML